MRHVSGLILKFMGVLAGMGIAALLLSGSGRGAATPYASALQSLATGRVAAAASKCSDRTCDASGTRCVHLNGSHTDCGVGDFCRTRSCP